MAVNPLAELDASALAACERLALDFAQWRCRPGCPWGEPIGSPETTRIEFASYLQTCLRGRFVCVEELEAAGMIGFPAAFDMLSHRINQRRRAFYRRNRWVLLVVRVESLFRKSLDTLRWIIGGT